MSESSDLTFEQSLSELDKIVRELEDGSVGLEQSLARYETGIALLKKCYAQLRDAEAKINQLTGCDEDGKPRLEPFGHTSV